MVDTIRKNLVLKQMDVKETTDGKVVVFCIVFISKKGILVFFPRAIVTGLPYSVKINRRWGILPVNRDGNKTDHVHPVGSDNLIKFNSKEVIL